MAEFDPCDVQTERNLAFSITPSVHRNIRPKKDLTIQRAQESCRVCGEYSTGYHYDVRSCNGCKSFFRRSLLEQRRFVCERDGNCSILPKSQPGGHIRIINQTGRTPLKSRQCRACRFQRCVEAGMNPAGILVETVHERDALKSAIKFHSMNLVSASDHTNRIIENLKHIELRHQLLRRSDFNLYPSNPQSILDVLARSTVMGLPLQEMKGWPLEQTCYRTVISLEEHAKLRIQLPRPHSDNIHPSFKYWFYMDLFCVIEWAKTLDFFRSLDLYDQRALIVFSAWQISFLTASHFSYLEGSERMALPDGTFSVWCPPEAKADVIRPMFDLQIDWTEYLLLKSLVICNPSCGNISEHARTIMQIERQKLSKLLFEHCMENYGRMRGPSRFGEIIALETTLLHQAQRGKHLQSLLVTLNLRPMKIVLVDEIAEVDHLL